MTKAEVRRRKRRKRKIQRAAAWALVIAVEILAAAVQTAIVAAVFIPLVDVWRGYKAFGGEWLLVAVLFCGAYCIIHRNVCNKIFEEGERG